MPTNSEIKELAEIIHRYKYSMNCTDNSGQSHADKCNRKDSLCVPCKEENFASFILKAGYIKKSPVPADIEAKVWANLEEFKADPLANKEFIGSYSGMKNYQNYMKSFIQELFTLFRPKLELTLKDDEGLHVYVNPNEAGSKYPCQIKGCGNKQVNGRCSLTIFRAVTTRYNQLKYPFECQNFKAKAQLAHDKLLAGGK